MLDKFVDGIYVSSSTLSSPFSVTGRGFGLPDPATAAQSSAGGSVHNDRNRQLELILEENATEYSQLQQRCAELESVVQEQLSQSQLQANAVKRLQAQIVLLEEQLRLTTDCSDRLQLENEQLRGSNQQLQRQAVLLHEQLATAVKPASASSSGTLAGERPAALCLATAPGRPSSVEAQRPTGLPSPGQLQCSGSLSAFAAAAAADDAFALTAAADMNATCDLDGSSGSAPIQTPGSAVSRVHSLSHTPLGCTPGCGLRIAASSCHLAASSSCTGMSSSRQESTLSLSPQLQQGSSMPHSLALSESLQSHQLASSGSNQPCSGSYAPAASVTSANSSQDFTRDVEVWPVSSRPHRTRSLLSARELCTAVDTVHAGINASSSCGAAAGAPLVPGGVSCNANRLPAGPTAPRPILAHQHSRHTGGGMRAGSVAGTLPHDSWHGANAAPLSTPGGRGASSTVSGYGLSPASWEHPLLLAGRQSSLLDPISAAASFRDLQAASAPTGAGFLAMPGAAAAAAVAAGLPSLSMDQLTRSSQVGGLLPYELERLVAEGSIGAAMGAAAAAVAASMSPSHMLGSSSVADLEQAAALQLQQQLQAQQVAVAAAAAAAAAAGVANGMADSVGGTVRAGKPTTSRMQESSFSKDSDLDRNRGGAVKGQGGQPVGSHDGGDAAAAASSREVSTLGRSSGAGQNAAAAEGQMSHVEKWDDTWGPEQDGTSPSDTDVADTDDSCDQDAAQDTLGCSSRSRTHNSSSVLVTALLPQPQQPASVFDPSRASTPAALQRSHSGVLNVSTAAAAADAETDGIPGQDLDAAAQNARLRSKADACPNTCVYVGFLGWWVSEKDLVEYFSPYGELASVRLLISKKSRRSREQAFVEYATVEQAQRAITWLDSIDYPALVKQLGCGGLVVRFADRKKPSFD